MKLFTLSASALLAIATSVDVVSAAHRYSTVKGGASGSAQATRYWDCCKPSCGWNGKADVTSPVGSCTKNGVTLADDNTQSGCESGGCK